jgi:hypothetical protein
MSDQIIGAIVAGVFTIEANALRTEAIYQGLIKLAHLAGQIDAQFRKGLGDDVK